jgi:hypothetical protein
MQGIPMKVLSRAVFFGLVVGAAIAWFAWPKSPHFTQQDIEDTKKSIHEQYEENQGVKVVEIKLIKETERKLMGFVKLEVEGMKDLAKVFGSDSSGTITKQCSATMGDDWEWVWRCE